MLGSGDTEPSRTTEQERPMNAYDRERAECAAEEEARADRRLRAWRRRQIPTVDVTRLRAAS